MTDLVEDAFALLPSSMPWTPPAATLSAAKIAEIKALAAKADQLVEASLSANTHLAYAKACAPRANGASPSASIPPARIRQRRRTNAGWSCA